MSAARAFLEGLIDYAGLFPPASLPMRHAVDDYFLHVSGEHGWMLQRFICPVSRLSEMLALDRVPPRLSLILDGDTDSPWAAARLSELERALADVGDAAIVETIETRWPPDELLPETFGTVFPFLEVSWDAYRHQVATLGEWRRGGAKLRTGGVHAGDIPDAATVGGFIRSCLDEAVPFKATAGLHHPFRNEETNGLRHHGFVNVFAAAVLGAVHGLDETMIGQVVADDDRRSFTMTEDMLFWRDLGASAEEIAEVRRRTALSYGSCSFTEPEEDLQAWGVI